MRGTVYSCSTIYRAFPGFEVPFTVAWIDLPTGQRALAKSALGLDETVKPGDRVAVNHDETADVMSFLRQDT